MQRQLRELATSSVTYLSNREARAATWSGKMEKSDLTSPTDKNDRSGRDLARRLERYRRRVEAEGRKRSLGVIDTAISKAIDPPEDDR